MLQVIYPINLDRWRFPVCTSLRELAIRNPQIDFYSFSKPTSEEDRVFGSQFWSKPHIHQISPTALLYKRFDIVHHASATTRNLVAASLVKARSLGKCVHIFTAPIQPHKDDGYYRQYVKSVYTADVLAAVSHAVAADIEEQFGRKVDAVIPSGVDLSFFSPDAAQLVECEKLGIRQPYVLFVGVLTARKRPDVFMQLASLLPELDFVMVGGFYNSQEEEMYSKAALEHPNLKCLGPQARTEVRNLMASAIALVFPSELEGLPLTILEASAMPEAVIEDVTGWLFLVNQLQVWAEKLKELLYWSDFERSSFSKKSRAFVTEHYSWDMVARQYADLYLRVAGR